jgi:hypothetical protein
MISPSGDPVAYRVRGALIALRREQSELIRIVRGATSTGAPTDQLSNEVHA